jgi:hypothetical protein
MRESTKPVASARPRRTPVDVRNRVSVRNQEPGYVYRLVNDIDDRVTDMQEQGYEVVTNTKVGDKRVDVSQTPGSPSMISVGNGIKAVLMRTKREYYNEDALIKQARVDAIEETMRGDVKRAGDYGKVTIS